VRDIDLKGKRILCRVDFNVPIKSGVIQDDTRIKAALPTINYILEKGAKSLVLMSHLGDPKKDMQKAKEKAEKAGKPFDEEGYINGQHRMAPIGVQLAKLLGRDVKISKSCIGEETKKLVDSLKDGEILLLENTRFHKEETSKDAVEREKLAKELATYGDIYVNDAFGTAHRAHASTETAAKYLPAVAGFLMERELEFLEEKIVKNPEKPFVAIIGGAKVSSKIGVIDALLSKVDSLIIGGGMAYTFLKAKGITVGSSLIEDDMIPVAQKVLKTAADTGKKILLPIDHIVTKEFSAEAESKIISQNNIDDGFMGMDIGPKTRQECIAVIKKAKTVFWNGPMGVFEFPRFAEGTNEIAKALADLKGAITVIGGGDSVSAVNKAGVADRMSHISTGGGASMELIEGKILPGVAALNDK